MMNFSQKTTESIGYYVYLLKDPRSSKIFYIGKGKQNRCFQHIREALEEKKESDKCETIRQIYSEGKTLSPLILRHGLTESAAFEIESACIDLLEEQLTNIVSGHESSTKGIMNISDIETLYSAEELTTLDDPIIFININKNFSTDPDVLYEKTRKAWKLDIKKASKAKYVIATFRGISRACYEIQNWYHSQEEGRIEFNGKLAPDEVIKKYVNKSIKKWIKLGAQNPIKYGFK